MLSIYLMVTSSHIFSLSLSLSGASRVEQLRAHKAAEKSSFTAAARIGAAYVLATRGCQLVKKISIKKKYIYK